MKTNDYPEKIYAIYDKECGKWNEFSATTNLDEVDNDFVEYTRSDLVEKLTSLPKWHKYPDEKPKRKNRRYYKNYLTTIKNEDGTFCTDHKTYSFCADLWLFLCREEKVIAWAESPEPYKED